jgi:hypothetical protein
MAEAQYFHVGVVVGNLEVAVEALRVGFATPQRRVCWVAVEGMRREVTFNYAYSRTGPPYLELMTAIPGTVWQPGQVAAKHIGYWVDDLETAARAFARRGYVELARDDDPVRERRLFVMLEHSATGLVVELVPRRLQSSLVQWVASA